MGLLNRIFFKIGLLSASNPCTSCFFAAMLTLVCSLGFINYKITSNPQELWVPKQSRANIEQTFFNNEFGAFFRINTFFFNPKSADDINMDIFQTPYLELLFHLQVAIETGVHTFGEIEVQADNFCYKPITGQGCIVTSPIQYWQSNLTRLLNDTDVKKTSQCIPPADATERVCFDKIGVPVMTAAIFGKERCEGGVQSACSACRVEASAFQITFLLNNNDYQFDSAQEWENQIFIGNIKTFNRLFDYQTELPDGVEYNETLYATLQGVLEKYQKQGVEIKPVKIDYLAERAIPDNIELEATQNAYIIFISYIMMFLYVSVSIGFFPSAVYNRFILGFAGIVVVIFALLTAIGITFYMGVPLTMISAEVVPFLILAIGVDNMFLISRAERSVPAHIKEMEMRVAFALKEIGPSIFAAAFCEALAFFIGMLTDIPALQSFCLVAGLSVIADFVLQITIFIAALTLDGKRIQNNRADILFCLKIEKVKKPRKEWIRTLFEKFFVPLIFNPLTQVVIFLIAGSLIVIAIFSCFKIKLGLNQNVSLVENTDIYEYFNVYFDYASAGPPAYLVFNNINYTVSANLDEMALMQVELATLNGSVISPVYSWVSSFQNFVKGGQWSDACGSDMVTLLDFDQQVREFVKIKVQSDCCQKYGICGEQYATDITFDLDGKVSATRFRFQHTPVRYQDDFINDLILTRRATDLFSEKLVPLDNGLSVNSNVPNAFTYSLFYVYYDQYTYIRGILSQNTLLGVAAVILALQVLSSLSIALLIGLCVFLVLFQLMGCMWMLNEVFGGYPIEMNAVFVVNLVTSLGFGVEFCNHIGMNFMRQTGTKEERAKKALAEMGSSVLVGIASTKFIGVIVLAFAPSTIFKLYYFRMYLFIILLGLFNGLMFLPLLLRWIGPLADPLELSEHIKETKEFAKLKLHHDHKEKEKQ